MWNLFSQFHFEVWRFCYNFEDLSKVRLHTRIYIVPTLYSKWLFQNFAITTLPVLRIKLQTAKFIKQILK